MRYYLGQELATEKSQNEQVVDLLSIQKTGDELIELRFKLTSFDQSLQTIYLRKMVGHYFYSTDLQQWKEVTPQFPLKQLMVDGKLLSVDRGHKRHKEEKSVRPSLVAPMPGLIAKLFCHEGDCVEKGDNLLILEAMKMENEIKAPHAGRIKVIHVQEGQVVDQGVMMIELESIQ